MSIFTVTNGVVVTFQSSSISCWPSGLHVQKRKRIVVLRELILRVIVPALVDGTWAAVSFCSSLICSKSVNSCCITWQKATENETFHWKLLCGLQLVWTRLGCKMSAADVAGPQHPNTWFSFRSHKSNPLSSHIFISWKLMKAHSVCVCFVAEHNNTMLPRLSFFHCSLFCRSSKLSLLAIRSFLWR